MSSAVGAKPGDLLLVEQVDRLFCLTASHWEKLKVELAARRVRVVALDSRLPGRWPPQTLRLHARMFDTINGMLLDMTQCNSLAASEL